MARGIHHQNDNPNLYWRELGRIPCSRPDENALLSQLIQSLGAHRATSRKSPVCHATGHQWLLATGDRAVRPASPSSDIAPLDWMWIPHVRFGWLCGLMNSAVLLPSLYQVVDIFKTCCTELLDMLFILCCHSTIYPRRGIGQQMRECYGDLQPDIDGGLS